jgi:hypothetical protein
MKLKTNKKLTSFEERNNFIEIRIETIMKELSNN